MKTIYNFDIISEFKNIKPGEIVIVNGEKYYMKITDGVDAELLNLIDGGIIEPKPTDVFHIPKQGSGELYEKENWFKEYYYVARRYPRDAVFFYEISGLSGSICYYKNEHYIVGDNLCAYNLKTGRYTPIESCELVIPADDNLFLKI